MHTDHLHFLELAIQKARESVAAGGFPAGAVLVKNDKVIAEGISIGYRLHDPTSHAETATVRSACQELATTDLSGCTLYASLQPCVMYYCSANWARVAKIVYGCQKTEEMVKNQYYEGNHNLASINQLSTHNIELEYISQFQLEMKKLISEWEKAVIIQ